MIPKIGLKKASALAISAVGIMLLLLLFYAGASYAYRESARSAVISPAYSFFVNVDNNNYKKAWSYLTAMSKKSIVLNIENAYKKDKISINPSKIDKSMKSGGRIAKAYWRGFLKSFNPRIVLKYSKWKIKFIHSNAAEIQINYKYSKQAAFFKLFKENNKWKFGLVESFLNRTILGDIAAKIF